MSSSPPSPRTVQVIDQVLGVSAATDTMTGQKLPSPGSVTVSVLNGTGVYNQATTTSAALQALGFHTVGVGDTPSVGVDSETVVYFQQKTAADQAAAQTVAASLSGAVITALGPTTDGAQVTVVTGSQFSSQPTGRHPALHRRLQPGGGDRHHGRRRPPPPPPRPRPVTSRAPLRRSRRCNRGIRGRARRRGARGPDRVNSQITQFRGQSKRNGCVLETALLLFMKRNSSVLNDEDRSKGQEAGAARGERHRGG